MLTVSRETAHRSPPAVCHTHLGVWKNTESRLKAVTPDAGNGKKCGRFPAAARSGAMGNRGCTQMAGGSQDAPTAHPPVGQPRPGVTPGSSQHLGRRLSPLNG